MFGSEVPICMQNKTNSYGCICKFILPPNEQWSIKSQEKAPVLLSSTVTTFCHQLKWYDFVAWAPDNEIHVERIFYDHSFINNAISKARTLYFDKFLPLTVPYTIVGDSCVASRFVVITTEIISNT